MTNEACVDEMDGILQDFIVETDELLSGLDQDLIDLEKTPESDKLLNKVFRSFHTIKGAAGFLGFNQVVDVAHRAEDCLNKLRQGSLKLTPSIMDAILKAVDMLKLLLFHIKEKDGKEEDLTEVLTLLTRAEGAPQPPPTHSAEAPTSTEAPTSVEAPTSAILEEKRIRDTEAGGTIRVDIKRLDEVMNMVGELVLGRNRLLRLASQLEARYNGDNLVASLRQTAYDLNIITTDLQLSVMKARMQPVSKVFSRFPRMVRDLARQKGKEVELILKGEEVEVDKTVIEEIGDPLVHLVRNAIDHGIETPDERVKAGKPSKGSLTLSAEHKGGSIFISIEDDGRGIDMERVKEKAVEKGLATSEDIGRLSEKDILNFIFQPGFSTAASVTDISGRGVGMDVVKTNITKLNGGIDIETTAGKGTKISLRLPLTLAIIQALMVRIGREDYAIPLSNVLEIIRIDKEDIKTVEGREVVYSRDQIYPLLRLSAIFADSTQINSSVTYPLPLTTYHSYYAVVMALGERRMAILVEELLGQEEVVIKSMGEYFSDINMKGFSGATITGDGRVVLILDVAVLFDLIS